MSANTPVYGWPYQNRPDSPDGAKLGELGFLAIEATVAANAAAVTAAVAAAVNPIAALAPKYVSRQIAGGTVAAITFSSIPSGLRRLHVVYSARADNAVQAQGVNLRINNDSTANYSYQVLQGSNATATAAAAVGVTFLQCGLCTGSSAAANIFGGGEFCINGCDLPHPNAMGMDFNAYALGVGAGNFVHSTGGGHWINPTGVLNRIDVFPAAGSFVAGTDVQVTGW